jgi:hypothetical protein
MIYTSGRVYSPATIDPWGWATPSSTSTADITSLTSWYGSSFTVLFACPVGMYEPTAGAGTCSACPAYTMTVGAGAIGAGSCVCSPGAGLQADNVTCAPCAANSYQPSAASAACTPCTAGSFSGVGASSAGQCMTTWCAQITVAGTPWSYVNGAYGISSSMYDGDPYYGPNPSGWYIYKNCEWRRRWWWW